MPAAAIAGKLSWLRHFEMLIPQGSHSQCSRPLNQQAMRLVVTGLQRVHATIIAGDYRAT
jgi:hypothetical protein